MTSPQDRGRPYDSLAPAPVLARTGQDEPGQLRAELEGLRRAMESRATIDLARGIMMDRLTITAQESWEVLVEISQRSNTKLRHVAHALVHTVSDKEQLPAGVDAAYADAVRRWTGRRGSGGS
ncbi:ANTAR domain-containing protein [Streptomyces sp. NPDC001941]|uniref:ANTAR domain-containing protein n=1 Tax=Streptomyces sp. NPDC001941 TaxID=3154659 RepID=UPI00331B9A70